VFSRRSWQLWHAVTLRLCAVACRVFLSLPSGDTLGNVALLDINGKEIWEKHFKSMLGQVCGLLGAGRCGGCCCGSGCHHHSSLLAC
jgi:hypothetical protein